LLEVFLPIIFVGFLVLIKSSVEDSGSFAPEEIPAGFPNDINSLIPFSFSDYVTALQAPRFCEEIAGDPNDLGISGINDKGYNWQVPFVKCDSRKCTEDGQNASDFCEYLALGVAPSTGSDSSGIKLMNSFKDYVYGRYPELLNKTELPFKFDFVKLFESEAAIEKYVTADDYKYTDIHAVPKLAMAVVFDGSDASITYNYKLRVNSTGFNSPEDESRPGTTTTPPTDKSLESFAREDYESCPILVGGEPEFGPYMTSCTGRYIYNGLISTQRLVNDFILQDSGAADRGYKVAEHGVKYAAFPTYSYVSSGFYAQIAGTLCFWLGHMIKKAKYSILTEAPLLPSLFHSFCTSFGDFGPALSSCSHDPIHCS
jgi:hypothetical protein